MFYYHSENSNLVHRDLVIEQIEMFRFLDRKKILWKKLNGKKMELNFKIFLSKSTRKILLQR